VGYRVRTEHFEGPFDLLLHLVSRQKLDVADISVSDVTEQYLEHVERMQDLDLDVASDFLLVAATLLEMKAAGLLPQDEAVLPEEYEDLSPEEAKRLLVARLLAYKQFKNVAGELAARMEAEGHQHARYAALEEDFAKLMPDFLDDVTLHQLGQILAELERRRRVFLLQAEHVAAKPVSVDVYIDRVERRLQSERALSFRELVEGDAPAEVLVGMFLAILELYKRERVELTQADAFGELEVVWTRRGKKG
jgi:segregation and condensation protein A